MQQNYRMSIKHKSLIFKWQIKNYASNQMILIECLFKKNNLDRKKRTLYIFQHMPITAYYVITICHHDNMLSSPYGTIIILSSILDYATNWQPSGRWGLLVSCSSLGRHWDWLRLRKWWGVALSSAAAARGGWPLGTSALQQLSMDVNEWRKVGNVNAT